MPLPTFIVVGAQKSGTTTLHDLLGQLPDAWMSDPKELHFFDKHIARGLEWYADQFRPGPDHQAFGECTPYYLYGDAARSAMTEALPDARFVAILREPVARAYSHYWFARAKGVEALTSFAEAIAAEPGRLARSKQRQPARFSYLDRGHYLRQVRALESAVGRDRMLVHLTDDLAADPRAVVRTTCRFLGLDSSGADRIEVRAKNTFADRTVNSAGGLMTRLEVRDGESSDEIYPPIDPALEQALRVRFRDENILLGEWLGRDLTKWLPR